MKRLTKSTVPNADTGITPQLKENFRQNLVRLRKSKFKTQPLAVEYLKKYLPKISVSQLCNWETENKPRFPRPDQREALAKAFGVTLDEMYSDVTGEGTPKLNTELLPDTSAAALEISKKCFLLQSMYDRGQIPREEYFKKMSHIAQSFELAFGDILSKNS